MKQGLIEIKVNKLSNISERVKQFIAQKSSHLQTPFDQKETNRFKFKGNSKAKRSLTDWRQLYNHKQTKILPKKILIQENEEIGEDQKIKRNCVTSQYRRKNRKLTTQNVFSFAEKSNLTFNQIQRQKNKKRQSLINFAIAQNCYEQEVLQDKRAHTANEKKFRKYKDYTEKKADYFLVGKFISDLSLQQKQEADMTGKYLSKLSDFQNVRFQPYNIAKIKEKFKINNNRFLSDNCKNGQTKNGAISQNGLRYYKRN